MNEFLNILSTIFTNQVLLVSVASWFIAQAIKILIDVYRYKKLDLSLIMSSGGMPSSHSSFTSACAMSIGFIEGFDSSLFALALVLTFVVMYDATGVRREAGKQAATLNVITKIIEHEKLNVTEDFKELLGHTPLQVFAGFVLGILVACISFL